MPGRRRRAKRPSRTVGGGRHQTFETLSRYADALGLRLELSLVETGVPVPSPLD